MMKMLIKGGIVTDKRTGRNGKADVLIENGIITKIAETIDVKADSVIDAAGKVVAAGLIDMHVHLREPGFEYKEDIYSGSRAAVAGGFTAVACMPNTNPVCDNAAVVAYIKKRAGEANLCRVYPIGAITKGLEGKELTEMHDMRREGAVAVSDDGKPVVNGGVMRRAILYASMFDLPVISHCEELSLLDGGQMNDSEIAVRLGLRPIVPAVEEAMVARDILIAEHEEQRVHIAHVSTKGSVELVRSAKKRGVRVTCETCPHYFSLTHAAVSEFDTNAKMNPPLRGEDDVKAIIKGLADGTIDCIVTDHAPHSQDEKQVEFEYAANGIIGLETSLALGITYLVKTGAMQLSELLYKMSGAPADILGVEGGILDEGSVADVVIFDPDALWQVDAQKLRSKSCNTPFDGALLAGVVDKTIVEGRVVFDGCSD